MRLLIISILILLFNGLFAQQVTIFSNATIHTGTGEVIEKGYLIIGDGKILDASAQLNSLYKNAKVIDVSAKHIYPGLIALNNYAGLNEIDAVRATRDYSEAGNFNPNARALIAFNTDSKILPTFSFNGILYTQAVPQGGIVSGSSSLMKTQGWNWEDAMVKADEGIHLNWPEIIAARGNNNNKRDDFIKQRINEIEQFFSNCNAYLKQNNTTDLNLKYESMRNVFNGNANLYVHTNGAKSMITCINYFKTQYPLIKIVLVGAQDAWQLTHLLKQHNIPVILSNIHSLPKHNHSDIDQPFKNAAMLFNAGILTAIGHNGSWEARNIMFNAGTTAAYGLSKEKALQLITYNPAIILGLQNNIGSIKKGNNASFVISEGDILNMQESKITAAYLNGIEIDLKNNQYQLYQKYLNKYQISE